MAKTCTIIKAGRADTYGRPLLVGQSYTGPDDEVFSLWQTGFATVDGAPGAFLPATAIQQQVVAQVNIPFLIMPGDGAANGCQFTGTNGTFTLSAAIIANIGTSLAGCYAYFSANFGGSSLPAGWYWTEFSSDTAGIVYAETYTTGMPRRPATKTAITPNLSGWVTATTNEVVGPQGFILPTLGKNGNVQILIGQTGSTTGTKSHRAMIGSTVVAASGSTGSPTIETLHIVTCTDSNTEKCLGRINASAFAGVGKESSLWATANQVSVDTSGNTEMRISLQQSTNVATPILLRSLITATYGE